MKNNNLTKLDLAKNLSKVSGFSVSLTKKLIDDLLVVLCVKIKKKTIILKNIGTFKTINKKKRFGRNPKTGESFVIKARKSISFICSKNLQNNLNR